MVAAGSPFDVSLTHRTKAWVVYCFLWLLFLVYALVVLLFLIQQRQHPAVSVAYQLQDFELPAMTLEFRKEGQGKVSSKLEFFCEYNNGLQVQDWRTLALPTAGQTGVDGSCNYDLSVDAGGNVLIKMWPSNTSKTVTGSKIPGGYQAGDIKASAFGMRLRFPAEELPEESKHFDVFGNLTIGNNWLESLILGEFLITSQKRHFVKLSATRRQKLQGNGEDLLQYSAQTFPPTAKENWNNWGFGIFFQLDPLGTLVFTEIDPLTPFTFLSQISPGLSAVMIIFGLMYSKALDCDQNYLLYYCRMFQQWCMGLTAPQSQPKEELLSATTTGKGESGDA